MNYLQKASLGAFLWGCAAFSDLSAQTNFILHTDQSKVQINKHIYGHFAEHLGRCIYGGIYVGENQTQIPHTDGVRNDMIEALKALKVPNLRWPGGCFADTYQWKDGVGKKENRPSLVNSWWGGVTEDNSFGTHDFLNLCERIGAEPYLAGNVGSGSVKDLSDWVYYVNHPTGSPMAKWRKENGREKPWNVRMWGVGNEAWGCGGNMTAEYYANIYKQYATFMNDVNPDAKLMKIASGATGDDYHWTETLMKNIPHSLLHGVALHHYAVIDWNKKGPSTAFTDYHYFRTLEEAWKMNELITRHSTVMDKYDPQKKVALIVDEWGGWYDVEPGTNPGFLYQQNTIRDALVAGMTLNIFNNHAERVRGANLAQIVNVLQAVILTEGEKMLLTPTYHVMKMYQVHQDAQLIPLDFTSPMYSFEGKSIPAITASASKDAAGILHISLTNVDPTQTHALQFSLRGENWKNIRAEIVTSPKVNEYNTFEEPNKITVQPFKKVKLQDNKISTEIPPHSVMMLTINPS